MAPPPKHLIARKLIRRYFKAWGPTKVQTTRGFLIDEFRECINTFGFGHEKCSEIQLKMAQMYDDLKEHNEKISQLNVK